MKTKTALSNLYQPQFPRAFGFRTLILALCLPRLECRYRGVIPSKLIKVLDLVNSHNPILTRKCFFEGVQCWANSRQFDVADTVLGRSGAKEGVVVVVR